MIRVYDVAFEGTLIGQYSKRDLRDVIDDVHRYPQGIHIEVKDRRRLRASLVTLARRRGMKVTTKWVRHTTDGNYYKCGLLWVAEAR